MLTLILCIGTWPGPSIITWQPLFQIDYIAGVAVAGFADLPATFARLRIPPQHYAVFTRSGYVSGIRGTWKAIWSQWLPASGHQLADAPTFERYGESFDALTGNGGFEIWVPLKV